MNSLIISNGFIPSGIAGVRSILQTHGDRILEEIIKPETFLNESITDSVLHGIISDKLNSRKYSKIFVPIFLGPTYSDFLGLRLGAHIRFTENKNQLSPIIFYSSAPILEICKRSKLKDFFFTKGVHFCKISKDEILRFEQKNLPPLFEEDLSKIGKQVNIPLPKSLPNDNHSVANEWGLFRLEKVAGLDIFKEERKNNHKLKSLYFKWLKIAYPLEELRTDKVIEKEKESYSPKLRGFKVLGKIDLYNLKKRNEEILVIDDKADKGWKKLIHEILKKKNEIKTTACTTVEKAERLLKEKEYDLIFLDLRIKLEDFETNNPKKLSSFQLIQDFIRKDNNKNFTTPIILFTASNKTWNINEFLEEGADFFYIKEHPKFADDIQFSQDNYLRLLENIKSSFRLKEKRRKVNVLRKEINIKVNQNISNGNIRLRIEEKLKIGYGILFRKRSEFENNTLLFNQEVLAFLVFWSILDEVCFDYLIADYSSAPSSANMKIRGKVEYFLEDFIVGGKGTIKNHYANKEYRFEYKKNSKQSIEKQLSVFRKKQLQLYTGEKISAILKIKNNWSVYQIKDKFRNRLGAFRNSIDFIHPSYETSIKYSLSENMDNEKNFDKCIELLKFIKNDLLT